jgi:hypothetical protein
MPIIQDTQEVEGREFWVQGNPAIFSVTQSQKQQANKKASSIAQVVVHLPRMCKALGLISTTAKR